jgi:hypothetical protein
MINIAELKKELLNKMFEFNVLPRVRFKKQEEYPKEYTEEEKAEILKLTSQKHTVVGIDIYQYSLFPADKQIFIPPLFALIYNHTWELITENYSYIFQHYRKFGDIDNANRIDRNNHFISTGDGGFQILETPIHAVLFVLTFATIVRFYNSDSFMRRLHAKIGNIELRYAITLDGVYKYGDNFYGAAIINNARILSKDKLNRLLIDKNTHDWYLSRMEGIENLMSLGINDIKDFNEFSGYNPAKITEANNALIPPNNTLANKEGIKSVDVQKIGKIKEKETELEIYNLHIQAIIHYAHFLLKTKERVVTISAGNLNIVGIGE